MDTSKNIDDSYESKHCKEQCSDYVFLELTSVVYMYVTKSTYILSFTRYIYRHALYRQNTLYTPF